MHDMASTPDLEAKLEVCRVGQGRNVLPYLPLQRAAILHAGASCSQHLYWPGRVLDSVTKRANSINTQGWRTEGTTWYTTVAMLRTRVLPNIFRPQGESMDLMSRFAACPPFTTLSGHHCGSCRCQDASSIAPHDGKAAPYGWEQRSAVSCNGLQKHRSR